MIHAGEQARIIQFAGDNVVYTGDERHHEDGAAGVLA